MSGTATRLASSLHCLREMEMFCVRSIGREAPRVRVYRRGPETGLREANFGGPPRRGGG